MRSATRFIETLSRLGRTGSGERLGPIELLRLRFGETRLGLSDLRDYEIRPGSSKAERDAFCGWRTEKTLDVALNTDAWRGIFDDKLNAYAFFIAHHVPFPRVLAVFNDTERHFPGAALLRSPHDVAQFLRSIEQPVFAKPVHGSFGAGSMQVGRLEPATGKVQVNHATSLDLDDLLSRLSGELRRGGYLFQDRVKPHPSVAELCTEAVSTLRMIVLLSPRPVLHRVVWKLPAAGAVTDHFREGAGGSLICAVDVQSGTVLRAMGRGPDGKLRQYDRHSASGQPLKGRRLPDFQRYRELVMSSASAFPGLRFQHWDVAITESGPMVLEVNTEGGVRIPQMAYGNGLLDQEMRTAIATSTRYEFG